MANKRVSVTKKYDEDSIITPSEYLREESRIGSKIQELNLYLENLHEKAQEFKMHKSKLRPVLPSDIFGGNVIYYFDKEDVSSFWNVVEEVLYPSDDFKAYVYNGCRYGLLGAYVENEE